MQDFRHLDVWEKAHKLALEAYRLTDRFPRSEMFGLSSQIRRSAASIPTNLAEGCGRTQAEFGKFAQIAFGSACELESQFVLARDLGFVTPESYADANSNVIEVKRMLGSLIKRIQAGLSVAASSRSAR